MNENIAGTSSVRVSGEIDMSNAPVFGRYLSDLIEEAKQDLDLDLSRIDFMDSSGVAVLLDVHRQLHDLGCRLLLVSSSAPVNRVLTAIGLDEVFGARPDAELEKVPALAEPA